MPFTKRKGKLLIMIKSNLDIKSLVTIFKQFPQVKLAYLFGSQAKGKGGPLSDYDFAVFLDEKDLQKRFDIRMKILDQLSQELSTEDVDLSVLNDVHSPELKYAIISSGKLIYQQEPFKILVEPGILNDYFDFIYSLKKYGLTKQI